MSVSAAIIIKRRENFISFLNDRGAEILTLEGDNQLVRFRTPGMTSTIFKNHDGTVTFFGEAEKAWEAYRFGSEWRANRPTGRNRTQDNNDVLTILERDGNLCFFCLCEMPVDDMTIEHLVARTHKGPNHISNKFLAHGNCNSLAGSLSAPEKIKMHATRMVAKVAEGMANIFNKDE